MFCKNPTGSNASISCSNLYPFTWLDRNIYKSWQKYLHVLTEIFTSLDRNIYMSWQIHLYVLAKSNQAQMHQQFVRTYVSWQKIGANNKGLPSLGLQLGEIFHTVVGKMFNKRCRKNSSQNIFFNKWTQKNSGQTHRKSFLQWILCLSFKIFLQNRHEKFVPDTKTLKLFFILWKTDPIAW